MKPLPPNPEADSPASLAREGFLRSRRIEARLFRSHLAVAAVGLFLLGLSLLLTVYLRHQAMGLARVHGPAAQSSLRALEGVERSLAALRGWVVLDDPQFTESRRAAWSGAIDPALERLQELDRRMGRGADLGSVREVRSLLHELKEIQWWVEDVAQTPGNEPARDMLMTELKPVVDDIYESITAMIDDEVQRGGEGRDHQILAAMADFRGYFTRSQTTLSMLVGSGSSADQLEFEALLKFARKRFADLEAYSGSLGPAQQEYLGRIDEELEYCIGLFGRVLARRNAPDWNIARFRLREEAVPTSQQATSLLSTLAEREGQRMRESENKLDILTNTSIGLAVLFLLAMAAAARFVAHRGAVTLARPITNLSQATREMAAGNLGEDIPVVSEDELGELTHSFNRMRRSLRESAEALNRREAESRTVIESSPSGMIMTDAKGEIVMLNKQAAALFGYTREELLGQQIEVLVPDHVRGHHHKLREGYMKHPEVRAMGASRDLEGRRKDGTHIPVEIGLNPIRTDQGLRVLARQAMEARLLHQSVAMASGTEDFEEALQQCIDTVCKVTGWPIGHVCLPTRDNEVLESSEIWHFEPGTDFQTFRDATARSSFAPGVGLPGRIWESGEPHWIVNVQKDPNFPRAKLCDDLGVAGAFGFPIKIAARTVAVLEFFTAVELEPDENLMILARSVGEQVGRVLERQQAQEDLRVAKDAAEAASVAKSDFLAQHEP